jgi:hypothetical protein
MKTGICKLHLGLSELKLSHFLPAGAYRLLVPDGSEIHQPLLMTNQVAMFISLQMRDYVLCADCEKRFDQGGEDYVISQMKGSRGFPLLERLHVSPAADFSLKEGVYAGKHLGIDTKKFAYFALSVAWRSAVHTWPSIRGHVPDSVELGHFQEPIRQFLLGEMPFPEQLTVLTTACTDEYSQHAMYAPTNMIGAPTPGISFLACGIHFLILMGSTTPPGIMGLCSFRSERGYLFSRDARAKTIHAYANLHSTARMKGLLARMNEEPARAM